MNISVSIRRSFSVQPHGRGQDGKAYVALTCDVCKRRWAAPLEAVRAKNPKGASILHLLNHAMGHEACGVCGREKEACHRAGTLERHEAQLAGDEDDVENDGDREAREHEERQKAQRFLTKMNGLMSDFVGRTVGR